MDGADENVIEVRDLVVRFGDRAILDGLDLDVKRGEILGVVGGSGTGKTVLLRAILGLVPHQSGEIRVFGQPIFELSREERLPIERRWGVLFQHGALFSSLNVRQNIQVPMREHFKLPQKLMDELADLKLSMVGLKPEVGNQMPSELSGGMIKRVALARALALDPDLVFLDEPTAGLDPIGAAAFDALIQKLKDSLGLTVYMVTHDLDSLYAICDRIAVLGGGKLLTAGPVEELEKFDHSWTREYFLGPRGRAASRSQLAASEIFRPQA
jgi:phospholipid/cholesterol/gamma-HCH transport system ATP-binding protein